MPIEIKELVITAHVGSAEAGHKNNAKTQAEPNNTPKLQGEAHEDLVTQCVEQVLEIIRKKTER